MKACFGSFGDGRTTDSDKWKNNINGATNPVFVNLQKVLKINPRLDKNENNKCLVFEGWK